MNKLTALSPLAQVREAISDAHGCLLGRDGCGEAMRSLEQASKALRAVESEVMATRAIAGLLAARLRLMAKLQKQHRDMGDTEVLLDVRDMFSDADSEALAAYEEHAAAINGTQALPFEVAS